MGQSLFCQAQEIRLQLNPNATIVSDVKSIIHHIEKRALIIELRTSRRCVNPTFRIRLSGPSLYILDLVGHDHALLDMKSAKHFFYPRSSVYKYNYPPIIEEGLYFIEVFALFCAHFDPNNFKDTCLEDVHDGRSVLNLPYSATLPVSASLDTPKRPLWSLAENSVKHRLLPRAMR